METPSQLRPYSGHRLDRSQNLGRAWSQTTQDSDLEGKRLYDFNSLGFRGPEFRSSAAFVVFAFGESDAFGIGVDFEDTWCLRVALAEGKRLGYGPEEICFMNFAEGGASNAAIARSVLTQCAAHRPDLVLVNFATHQRIEGFSKGHMFPVGDWAAHPDVERQISEAPEADDLRSRLKEQMERSRAFLAYSDENQGIYQSVRDMLLVQETLAGARIRAISIIREPEIFNRADLFQNKALGPLLARLNRRFFASQISPLRLLKQIDWTLDGSHFGAKSHAKISETVLKHLAAMQETTGPPPAQRMGPTVAQVGDKVRDFYMELPFNYHGSLEDSAAAIRLPSIRETYPDLDQWLTSDRGQGIQALEVGCGAGWLAHGLALHYGLNLDAIDLTPMALERARALAPILGTEDKVRFRECNVFEFDSATPYDLIISMGVLHHTGDAFGALERLVRYLKPGGHLYLGLYHGPGRMVFLEEMWRIAREQGEEASFQRYCELSSVHAKDATLARSWFRDQVLHPHETQHTLQELDGWFDLLGLELASTSINRFAPIKNKRKLFKQELEYEARSRKALFKENRYFPGFFTALARKKN